MTLLLWARFPLLAALAALLIAYVRIHLRTRA